MLPNDKPLPRFIEESIDKIIRGFDLKPNNEVAWERVRQLVSNFLATIWRNGVLKGDTSEEAFFIRVDRTTMTQDDIDNGRLNIEVGFAPLKPAEFVIFRIGQKTAAKKEEKELSDSKLKELNEIALSLQHNIQSIMSLGLSNKVSKGAGQSILFVGASGTEKTLGAEILGRNLGLNLYRVDLSGVVSKFIGETEKNLEKVFDEAGKKEALLMFDEAEALFGKRTEVKDSHDRYSNLEISYLLQRIESHPGVIILSINTQDGIDEALLRRIRSIVQFH